MREIAGGFEAFESAHDEGRNDGTHTDVYKHTQGSTLLLTRVMPKLDTKSLSWDQQRQLFTVGGFARLFGAVHICRVSRVTMGNK